MLSVHLRVSDAATNKPTAVRLRITGPDGTPYFPFGSHHEFPLGRNEDVGGRVRIADEPWVYIDGGCEIRLPSGVPLRVRATKGPEFLPVDETVTLGPGQMALRFAIRRWKNLADENWHAGDVRTHYIPPHALALEAAAEGIRVANLLAVETPTRDGSGRTFWSAPHLTAFGGQKPSLVTDSALVAVNTLNVHPLLGSVGLLHSHRIVFPLNYGGDSYPDDWSICDWCDQCHRKKGLAVWVDPMRANSPATNGEALAAAILKKVDAVECDGRHLTEFVDFYYGLRNAGVEVALVGSSGKDSNSTALGSVRTVAQLPEGEPLGYTGWIEAVRLGRCYVTTGPLLSFLVGPAAMGETHDRVEPGIVPIAVQAESATPFDGLELIANGRVVATAVPREANGIWLAFLGVEYEARDSAWLAARVVGPPSATNPGLPTFAHTTPTTILVDSRPLPVDFEAVAKLRNRLLATEVWAETTGRYSDPKWKRDLLFRCTEALAVLASLGIEEIP